MCGTCLVASLAGEGLDGLEVSRVVRMRPGLQLDIAAVDHGQSALAQLLKKNHKRQVVVRFIAQMKSVWTIDE